MMQNILKWLAAVVAVAFGWIGDMPSVIRILLIVMALDVFTGVAQAVIKKNLDSGVAFNGVAKKAVTLIIVALTYIVASQIAGVDASAPIGQAVAGFYIAVEVISILEKADAIGIPIPEFLRAALNNLKYAERRNLPTDPPRTV
jgi:toxin secretion/phage lysis holin